MKVHKGAALNEPSDDEKPIDHPSRDSRLSAHEMLALIGVALAIVSLVTPWCQFTAKGGISGWPEGTGGSDFNMSYNQSTPLYGFDNDLSSLISISSIFVIMAVVLPRLHKEAGERFRPWAIIISGTMCLLPVIELLVFPKFIVGGSLLSFVSPDGKNWGNITVQSSYGMYFCLIASILFLSAGGLLLNKIKLEMKARSNSPAASPLNLKEKPELLGIIGVVLLSLSLFIPYYFVKILEVRLHGLIVVPETLLYLFGIIRIVASLQISGIAISIFGLVMRKVLPREARLDTLCRLLVRFGAATGLISAFTVDYLSSPDTLRFIYPHVGFLLCLLGSILLFFSDYLWKDRHSRQELKKMYMGAGESLMASIVISLIGFVCWMLLAQTPLEHQTPDEAAYIYIVFYGVSLLPLAMGIFNFFFISLISSTTVRKMLQAISLITVPIITLSTIIYYQMFSKPHMGMSAYSELVPILVCAFSVIQVIASLSCIMRYLSAEKRLRVFFVLPIVAMFLTIPLFFLGIRGTSDFYAMLFTILLLYIIAFIGYGYVLAKWTIKETDLQKIVFWALPMIGVMVLFVSIFLSWEYNAFAPLSIGIARPYTSLLIGITFGIIFLLLVSSKSNVKNYAITGLALMTIIPIGFSHLSLRAYGVTAGLIGMILIVTGCGLRINGNVSKIDINFRFNLAIHPKSFYPVLCSKCKSVMMPNSSLKNFCQTCNQPVQYMMDHPKHTIVETWTCESCRKTREPVKCTDCGDAMEYLFQHRQLFCHRCERNQSSQSVSAPVQAVQQAPIPVPIPSQVIASDIPANKTVSVISPDTKIKLLEERFQKGEVSEKMYKKLLARYNEEKKQQEGPEEEEVLEVLPED